MPRTRSATRSVAEAVLFNADTLSSVASFLSCRELARLSFSSKKLLSSVDGAVVSAMNARYGGDEDLTPLEELRALTSPLEFDCLLGERIAYVGDDKAVVYSSNPNTLHTPNYIDMRIMSGDSVEWADMGDDASALCSNYIMTSGKHFVEFNITTTSVGFDKRYVYCRFGIMRPIGPEWREVCSSVPFSPLTSPWFIDHFLGEGRFLGENKTEAWGSSNNHACLCSAFEGDGRCEWGDWDTTSIHNVQWAGRNPFFAYNSGTLGLLLDLDEGTLSVYKDGRRIGVMVDGLTGEYCWVVNVQAHSHGRPDQHNIRIRRAPIPGDA